MLAIISDCQIASTVAEMLAIKIERNAGNQHREMLANSGNQSTK